MIINSATLDALRVGFKTTFTEAFSGVQSLRDRVAEVVPSSTKEEKYGWLGELPGMREWIGPRVIHNLAEHSYAIKNRKFELTVGVDKDDIEDDTLGTYTPRFRVMGRSAARHPEQLVFGALKDGFTTPCYDGQFFFDTDHPVLDKDGKETSVSNFGGGSGAAWFLLAANEVIKPIIFQERKAADFVYKDKPTDDNVFMEDKYYYGVSARYNVGYGFWQMAYGSRQTLDETSFVAAFSALSSMKGDYDQPLGITPNLLVVPPTLAHAARKLLNAEQISGTDNVLKGTAEVLVCPWLA